MATRNGKIANLPNDIREQLNLRLLEGETGRDLAAWLNALPAVQSVLGSQFNGSPISEVNLTHWRQGGYLQWITERECFDSARAVADGDCDLAQIGFSAERLLNILTVRIGQLLMRWDFSPDESVSDSLAFSQVARKARILQGLSRYVLAIHRIQSRSPSQKSEPAASSEPIGRGAGGGKERGEPIGRGAEPIGEGAGGASGKEASRSSSGKERGEPPNAQAAPEKHAVSSPVTAGEISGTRLEAHPKGTVLPTNTKSAEANGEVLVGCMQTAEHLPFPVSANPPLFPVAAKILSGPVSPSNRSQTPFKPDLNLSEILDAV